MIGLELLQRLRQIINEDASSAFLDTKTSYFFLWEAAEEFVSRTNTLKTSQSITTVADQSSYVINADFLELYMTDDDDDYVIKYNDGNNNTFIGWKDYDEIIVDDNTDSVTIPDNFSIINKSSLYSRITGTATSTGTASGGESTLTDTSGDFSNAAIGDSIYNSTDGSSGVILSKTSSTVIVTALFGGTNNEWTSGDSYVIQPQFRFSLELSPPPSTAGHTVTLYYLRRPSPVFSDYGLYEIPQKYNFALVKYAAWLYKYRDRERNYSDPMYTYWDLAVRKASRTLGTSLNKRRDTFSLKV